jgi:hypothetical protein
MLYYIKSNIPFLYKHPPCDQHDNAPIRLMLINIIIFSLLQFSHYQFRCGIPSIIS